jgi:hypothetical protein
MFETQTEERLTNRVAGSHTRRRGNHSPSEFSTTKRRPRLITVCAWCKGAQKAEGFWRHAKVNPQTDAAIAVSHGICPQCAVGLLASAHAA